MTHDDVEQARRIVADVLSGRVDLITGCRRILPYRQVFLSVSDDAWDLIRGIESETDHLPAIDTGHLWNSDVAAKKTAEIAPYLEELRPVAIEAFNELAKALP